MTFQGDVAGIGLGELLQGLARGGRDGVLTLFGDKLSSQLGLKGGQLFLLAGPDEKESEWRDRCQRAYADDPQPILESSRRATIARATRLENFYQLLGTVNVHFRFEPGALPAPPSHALRAREAGGSEANENLWGPGLTVEYLLLEHARIADESSDGPAGTLVGYDIPRALDSARHAPDQRDFLQHCNGGSTLQEIADRLGWSLTQVRATVGKHLSAGHLRLAQPRELLATAQRELALGRVGRAASRLTGWVRSSVPGAPNVGDADLLVHEWESGRLRHILHALSPRDARALLRRLDLIHVDVHAARERWHTLHEAHRADELTLLHEVALRLISTEEPETRIFHDLLRLARVFQERGHAWRTRLLLRLASNHLPSNAQTRVELGKRMLETGLVEEGTRWLLDAARVILGERNPERALTPIRAILRAQAEHPEAVGLLVQARALLTSQRRRRMGLIASLSGVLVLSLVAVVRYQAHREFRERIMLVEEHIAQPSEALTMLEELFPEDDSETISELRTRVQQLKKEEERVRYQAWDECYVAVEEACNEGDPLLALRRVLELPERPALQEQGGELHEKSDLFNVLLSRLERTLSGIERPVGSSQEGSEQEEEFVELLASMQKLLELEGSPDEVGKLAFLLEDLRSRTETRCGERVLERRKLFEKELASQQDMLLAAARSHVKAGDLERAIVTYDRLLATERSLANIQELREEVEGVRAHWDAVLRALELAGEGDHSAARKALSQACPNPGEHVLPWKVTSRPLGASVHTPDGKTRLTPFVMKSAFGEELELTFDVAGCVERRVTVKEPKDLVVDLHRAPERTWRSDHAIEAAPVAVGDDHVVADRRGRLARLDDASQVQWEIQLETLGGIARTPLFLPGRSGFLLVLSEDGRVWLVNAQSGSAEGPLDLASPPVEGPRISRGGIFARFANGRVAVWTKDLKPTYLDGDPTLVFGAAGATGPVVADPKSARTGMIEMLRRSATGGTKIKSPWTEWMAEVSRESVRVVDDQGRGFTVECRGVWEFLAWEAPKALIPQGRLWVSDGLGLRSYLPTTDGLIAFGR